MIQKIKISILSFLALFMFSVPLIATGGAAIAAPVPPTINDCLAQGSNLDLQTGECTNKDTSGGGTDLTTFIAKALNVISIVVGVVAVVMIIVGGFRYIASGGKQESVTSAKNNILYALIGLIIVALAQVIVRFVLNKTL